MIKLPEGPCFNEDDWPCLLYERRYGEGEKCPEYHTCVTFDALAAAVADAGFCFTLFGYREHTGFTVYIWVDNEFDGEYGIKGAGATPTLALLAAIKAYNEREEK